jgi:hypothetical protein
VTAVAPGSPAAGSGTRTVPKRRLPALPPAVGVGLLCLVVLVVVDLLIAHEHGLSGDEPFYERIAAHPSGPHNFPYAYRVGVPWLVYALPFSHADSFTGLALVAIAASAGVLYALLERFGVGSRLATGLALGYALSPTLLAVLVRHGRSIDPASMLVMMLGTLFVADRRRIALGITLLVGVTVRESTLFLIPFAYAVWARRLLDREALRDVAVVSLAPAALYALLRSSIATAGRVYIPGYRGPFLDARFDLVGQALRAGVWEIELRRLAYTYGPLWFVAPFALPGLRFARAGLVLGALCAVSMTFAFDWGRIAFLAAPVVYVSAGWVLRERRRLAIATVALLLAVDLGYGVYLQAAGTSHLDKNVGHGIPVF